MRNEHDADRDDALNRQIERDEHREPHSRRQRLARPIAPPVQVAAAAATATVPLCYACDAPAVGTRDRTREDGVIAPACARHADADQAVTVPIPFESLDDVAAAWRLELRAAAGGRP